MKPLRVSGVMALFLVLVVAAGFGTYEISHTYLARAATDNIHHCQTKGTSYHVTFLNGVAIPHETIAKLCDTLTITNLDSQDRLIAFGPHDNHITYDGVSARLLARGQSLTVTLVQTGTFLFHDHLDYAPLSSGSFTVQP